MTKELYLMRHGETLFNVLHRIQGSSDSPLTEKGIKDAKTVGNYFKKNNIIFDHVYSSTQERASDTLENITKQSYERIKGLKEWNFGTFEGQTDSLNPHTDPQKHSYGDFFVQFGGESDLQVQERMVSTLTKIMDRPHHDKVLVVSHGGAVFMFLRRWLEWDQIHNKINFSNCCILKFTYNDQKFIFKEVIDVFK